jgi:NodT family efflux transporter outer membrane factor (OMF) lipoprotein
MKHLRLLVLAAACAGCTQTPRLDTPVIPMTGAFKEAANAPAVDAAAEPVPQAWWTMFQDAELDALQQQLLANSPDLGTALARYQQARAATDSLRAAKSPTLGVNAGMQRSGARAGRPARGGGGADEVNSASLGLELEYEVDLWGRVRQQVRAGVAEERAAGADLAAARLALQAQLADTFIALRGVDAELALLRDTDAAYTRAAQLVERRHQLGAASGLDAARSQTQMESTRSQLRQVQAERAVLEHAIAALVGANPSGFAIQARVVDAATPLVPLGVPSTLLQRRPDIAAARYRMSAALEGVGVARSAWFPSLTIGASGGVQGSELARLVSMPNLAWALGAAVAGTVFDGGRRQAQVAQSEAVLEESGQRYRSTVLAAFQQVEDQLAMLTHFGEARDSEQQAAAAAQRAVDLATRRYEQGAATYLDVITAQMANLAARRSSVELATRHRRAAVQLVRALGGGWAGGAETG